MDLGKIVELFSLKAMSAVKLVGGHATAQQTEDADASFVAQTVHEVFGFSKFGLREVLFARQGALELLATLALKPNKHSWLVSDWMGEVTNHSRVREPHLAESIIGTTAIRSCQSIVFCPIGGSRRHRVDVMRVVDSLWL
jgi:hypothetical protein